VINSAVVFSKGDTLFPDDLDPLLYGRNILEEAASGNATSDYHAALKPLFEDMCLNNEVRFFDSFISAVEKTLFTLTMEKYNNNEVQAANFLSISRNTLRQRLKKFNL
jgi:DNA-binding protein Fis